MKRPYIYKNDTTKSVNVRGYRFNAGKHLHSNIKIKQFQKAVDDSTISLEDESVSLEDTPKPTTSKFSAEVTSVTQCDTGFEIAVTAKDSKTKDAIEGATVKSGDVSSITDTEGNASITVESLPCKVYVKKKGYTSFTLNVQASEADGGTEGTQEQE